MNKSQKHFSFLMATPKQPDRAQKGPKRPEKDKVPKSQKTKTLPNESLVYMIKPQNIAQMLGQPQNSPTGPKRLKLTPKRQKVRKQTILQNESYQAI